MNFNYCAKVTIDDYEIIESGIIDLWKNEFNIEIKGIKLHFSFDDIKDDDPKLHMVGTNVGNNTINFSIRNMNNALGEGFFKPIELGEIDKRKFFITFSGWSYNKSNNIRSIVYNLLLK